MAKRKLSPKKRARLRGELKASVASGLKVSDVLRDVAKKYGITTITARWYLKSLDGNAMRKSGRGPGRPPGRPAGSNSIAALLKTVLAKAENAKAAHKLLPRWKKFVENESDLRSQIGKLERRLKTTLRKASKLRTRLGRLVGV